MSNWASSFNGFVDRVRNNEDVYIKIEYVAKLPSGDRAVYFKNGERVVLEESTFKRIERRLRYED